ncbi:MAG: GIY-YIG nuclease family protein [Chlorobi bacterium]|nr:GIY-YIG nuclease family protein [Chlorobiota bacterium]
MFFTYVLYSPNFKKFYKGQTNNLKTRLKQHNSGKVKSTKSYRPWEIVYYEEFDTREQALQREQYFKSGAGRRFLKMKIKLR